MNVKTVHPPSSHDNHVFKKIQFEVDVADLPYSKGLMQYDEENETVSLYTDIPNFKLQLGQEIILRGYNRTGEIITNGTPVYKTTVGSENRLIPADAASALTSISTIGIATHDIPDDTVGIATRVGTVRSLNTTAFSAGDILYLEVGGGITNSMPPSPNYTVILGNAGIIHVTDGEIDVSISIRGNTNDVIKIFNGAILEDHEVDISSNGTTVSLTLQKFGGGDLSLFFNGEFTKFDSTDPVASVNLTAGSDESPTLNYIYIPESTGVLTISTTGFPSTQHVPVASAVVQSASSLQTDGCYKCHAWTDHLSDTNNQGHLSHLNAWIRSQHATYKSGGGSTTTITNNGGEIDNIDFSVTSAIALQLHDHNFPVRNTSNNDPIFVVNDFTTPNNRILDLGDIITDSLGGTLRSNNSYYSIVIWGVLNETQADCKLFANAPGGSYSNSTDAREDPSGYSNGTIPINYKGTGFLIANVIIRYQTSGSGTFTEIDTVSLLGVNPSLVLGGGTPGSGTEFSDNIFSVNNVSDVTKKIAFDASNISTATKRIIKMPDNDVDLGATKTGTISSPPSGLSVGEFWRDTTESSTHPAIRISTVTT